MCGIAGIATRHGSSPDEGLLRRLSEAVAHRGPDGEGIWTAPGVGLAHRRLAIIDLSPAGAQPMHDATGSFTITYNGEIYNYRQLRHELEGRGAKFLTSSDTEVILEAYRAWGDECLEKLRGMFAFALWDGTKKRLLLARDRIGKKPLFYSFTGTHDLAFASELKALAPAVPLEPDWDAVRLFLGLQYVPSPRTGFANVFQLRPGEYGVFDADGWKIHTYHQWDVGAQFIAPVIKGVMNHAPTEIDETIRSLLDDAVRLRLLAADVPVGAFLSGGIDSAAVVAFASRHARQALQTFTMGFPNLHMDERREARSLAQAFRTEHHEFEAKPADLQTLADELVRHYDAPYADSSALPLWLLAKETSKHIKVVLTGDGGDETFGGYRRYAAYERALGLAKIPGMAGIGRRVSQVMNDPRFARMAETIRALKKNPTTAYGEMFCGSYFNTSGLRGVFADAFLLDTEHDDAVAYIAREMGGDTDVGAAMRFDLTSYLPDDLNVKMDRATMRWGLEARAPFLDQKLVQFALSLPLNQKVVHGKTKIALKRALKGILPDDVLARPKRGFQVPLAEWFRGPLRPMLRERIMDTLAPVSRMLRSDGAARLIAENDRGADHGNRLWMLFSLSTWLAKYVTK